MYAKEMRNMQRNRMGVEGGSGDGPSPASQNDRKLSSEHDDFSFGYGNYGDPHSFVSYQLLLLLLDFVFNWTMDLFHEDPLVVLVIFVFQSLAIIINLILYIMSSANQAMQAGLHKRVTIHHWLCLATCLTYIICTGWWFIWALRKSWPSVSDQFSFTWPTTSLQAPVNSSLPTLPLPKSNSSSNGLQSVRKLITGNSSRLPDHGNGGDINKEHYTLWSNGFIALFVCHRVVAILYYFIYLRAIFIVLNTPDIDRFVEKKKNLVERFWEVKRAEKRKKRGKKDNSTYSSEAGHQYSMGLSELLVGSSKFRLESEALRQESQSKAPVKTNKREAEATTVAKAKSKRQILWADDRVDDYYGDSNNARLNIESATKEKLPKGRRRRSEDSGDGVASAQTRYDRTRGYDENERNSLENNERKEKGMQRERENASSKHTKSLGRNKRYASEDDTE